MPKWVRPLCMGYLVMTRDGGWVRSRISDGLMVPQQRQQRNMLPHEGGGPGYMVTACSHRVTMWSHPVKV